VQHQQPLKATYWIIVVCFMQVGGPFAGKTTVARSVAQMFGLQLLAPEQLVSDAVAAAQAWEQQQVPQQPEPQPGEQQQQQQQQQQHAVDQSQGQQLDELAEVAAAAEPPKQVLLGQRALQELQQGASVSDALLVELLVQGMLQAKDYAPAPPEPPPVEVKGPKGGKGATKTEPAASTAGGRGSTGGAANPAGSTTGGAQGSTRGSADLSISGGVSSAVLPAHLAAAAGAQGRGFVIDGFPATAEQAVLLERALTGLDLAAEQALVDGASLVAPPPLDVLPQLQRPLLSGLDAVLVLGCGDEAVAAKRALGRRLDPTTGETLITHMLSCCCLEQHLRGGVWRPAVVSRSSCACAAPLTLRVCLPPTAAGRIYHLEFDPPPANVPGLSERLIMVTGPDNDTAQVRSNTLVRSFAQPVESQTHCFKFNHAAKQQSVYHTLVQ
jgi:hypothetical protein